MVIVNTLLAKAAYLRTKAFVNSASDFAVRVYSNLHPADNEYVPGVIG